MSVSSRRLTFESTPPLPRPTRPQRPGRRADRWLGAIERVGTLLQRPDGTRRALDEVARLLVGGLASCCAIAALEQPYAEEGGVRDARESSRLRPHLVSCAVAPSVDPASSAELLARLRHSPLDPLGDGTGIAAIRSGSPLICDAEDRRAAAPVAPMRSLLVAPLCAFGRVYGLLVLVSDGALRYTARDAQLAATLAGGIGAWLACSRMAEVERAAREESGALRERLDSMLYRITDAFMALDRQWRVVDVNQLGVAIMQRPRDEVIGACLWDLFPATLSTVFYEQGERSYATQQPAVFEGYYEPLHLWVEVRTYPSSDGMAVFFRDITERKKAEAGWKFLNEASSILDASLDVEVTLQSIARLSVPALADWCVIDVLDEPLRLAAQEPAAAYRPVAMAHADPEKEPIVRELRREYALPPDAEYGAPHAMRTGRAELGSVVADEQLARAARSPRHLEAMRAAGCAGYMCVPLVTRGRVLGAITLVVAGPHRRLDAADLALAEELARRVALAIDNARLYHQAERASARSRALLSGAPNATFVASEDERFVQVNDAAAALTGYDRDRLLSLSLRDLVSLAGEPGRLVDALLAGASPCVLEGTLRHRSGATIPVEVSVALVSLPDGARQLVATVVDLRPRKQLERNLATAEKLNAVGQLAAGVAHDINNYLAGILGPAQLARDAVASGAAARDELLQDLDFIIRAAEDTAQTVRRLQLLARRSRGEPAVQQRTVYPDEIIDDVIAITRPRWRNQAQAEGRQINVVSRLGGAPPVLADTGDLREVLVNLVTNAADALVAGGTITIETGSARSPSGAPLATLTVRDTGVGMDEEVRAHLFEPFFTTKPAGKGTGLGLAMVQGIVGNLGGSIAVESAPGLGTTIRVVLPASHAAAARPERGPGTRGAAPLRVLIVEDEDGLREVATRMLRRDGHLPTSVRSAEDALLALGSPLEPRAFDVLVTDIGLPGMSGWQLLQLVGALYPAMPVVVVSGWGGSITDEELAVAGIERSQVVAKPYQLADLRRVLAVATREKATV